MTWSAAIARWGILVAMAVGVYVTCLLQFDTHGIRGGGNETPRKLPTVDVTDAWQAVTDKDIIESQARPLFSASRRPFVAKLVKVATPQIAAITISKTAGNPRRIRMLGVTIFGDDTAVLVQNRTSKEIRWIKKGQSFDGWILVGADKESAHFVCAQNGASDCIYEVALYARPRSQ